MARHLAAIAILFAMVVAGPLPVASAAPAAASVVITTPDGLSCGSTGRGRFDYPGPAASRTYDDRFGAGPRLPQAYFDRYIPQGLGTWPDFGGAGSDLLLTTGYNNKLGYSGLIGLKPGGGHTRVVHLPKQRRADGAWIDNHVGGVAVIAGHLFVQGPKIDGHATVQRFSLAGLRPLLATGGTLRPEATITLAYGSASFLANDGATLFAGSWESGKRGKMRRYRVGADGGLTPYGDPLTIPPRVQGLVVTPTAYIFSTSWGRKRRSVLYVMQRTETDLNRAAARGRLVCFAAPSMSEGLTRSNGRLYVQFESGSYAYDHRPCVSGKPTSGCTLNILRTLHRAKLSSLTSLIA